MNLDSHKMLLQFPRDRWSLPFFSRPEGTWG